EAAWITARNIYGPNSKYVLVSFGTGITPTELDTDPKSGDGDFSMAGEIIDLLLNAAEDVTDQNLKEIFNAGGYYRWQKEIKSVQLNDASNATMEYLTEQANALLDDPKIIEKWEMMSKELSKAENTEPYAQPPVD